MGLSSAFETDTPSAIAIIEVFASVLILSTPLS
jgi:hypothetical protein